LLQPPLSQFILLFLQPDGIELHCYLEQIHVQLLLLLSVCRSLPKVVEPFLLFMLIVVWTCWSTAFNSMLPAAATVSVLAP
jgi:hypothetical protein